MQVPKKIRRITRLLLNALGKLPSRKVVGYRAIDAKLGSDGADYSNGQELIWGELPHINSHISAYTHRHTRTSGGFSSCSTNGDAIRKGFLDGAVYRTLFAITMHDAKSIAVRPYRHACVVPL